MQRHFIGTLLIVGSWLSFVSCYYQCNQQSVSCGCGMKKVKTSMHINRGENAVPYSWTMIVSLRYDCLGNGNSFTHCCSGTILSESWILIAAHCVERINETSILLDNITITTGRFSRFQQYQTTRRVDHIFIHPNWTKTVNGFKHDIAILHLEKPLDFKSNLLITRTCLPMHLNSTKNFANSTLSNNPPVVIGWGLRRVSNFATQDALQQTKFSSISHNYSSCAIAISDIGTQFCLHRYENCTGSCVEDFSGPIFRWIGNRWEQIGIISYGTEGFGSANNIIVSTYLAVYYTWIKEITNLKSYTSSRIPIFVSSNRNHVPIYYECNKTKISCGCGLNNVALTPNRIVNGEEAIPYSWSMIISLRFDCLYNGNITTHCCGGTILNEHYILTAAHCVDKINLFSIKSQNITIAAGIHNLTEPNQTIRHVDQIFIHSDYRGSINRFRDDIAILHLSEPLDLDTNPRITQTCRSSNKISLGDIREYPSNGSMLAVIGWGLLNRTLNLKPQLLQQLNVYAIHHIYPSCAQYIGYVDVQFCAGVYESNKGPCNGDSGGPIMLWLDDHWEQVGIASYVVRGCAAYGYPSVYTRLAAYNDWIEWIINQQNYTTTTTTMAYRPPTIYSCDNKKMSCGCGSTNVALSSVRLIGGSEAIPYSWSMIVSVQYNCYRDGNFKAHCCSGTILNEHYILTAAQCVEQFYHLLIISQNITVVAGIHNLTEINQTTRQVDQIFIYPEYAGQSGLYKNDIAILHLSEPLHLDTNLRITKTCLPSRINSSEDLIDYPSNGSMLIVIGWGATNRPVNIRPSALQQLSISAIHHNDSTCTRSIGHVDVQFCGGVYEGGKGICSGDSGGPVFQWLGDHWEQVGISSYMMNGCASIGYQSIFTRVASFYDWINKVINQVNHTTLAISKTTIVLTTTKTFQPNNGLMSTYIQKPYMLTFKILLVLITLLQ